MRGLQTVGTHFSRWPVLLLPWLLALPVQAQLLRGRVLEAGTGLPVLGAHVVLVDGAGRNVIGVLTNEQGAFAIDVRAAGRYHVLAEMIGRRTATSTELVLSRDSMRVVTLELAPEPVLLAKLDVSASRTCALRTSGGAATQRVWEEARKALAVEAEARAQQRYRFDLARFERRLDPAGQRVLEEHPQFLYRVSGEPFISHPAEELASKGYIALSDSRYYFYGPNGDVLLSGSFLDTHCFTLRRDSDHEGQIGLVFEPVPRRRVSDITGVIWLNQRTSELRSLEFRYTRVPSALSAGAYGGHVEFEHLPDGSFVVHSWEIRTPIVELVEQSVRGARMAAELSTQTEQVVGIHAEGGEVTSVFGRDGKVLGTVQGAVLAGMVYDSAAGAPLVDAEVYLDGTSYITRTDAEGRFRITDLPAKSYSVAFRHPRLSAYHWSPLPEPVTLSSGLVTEIALAVPARPPRVVLSGETNDDTVRAIVPARETKKALGASDPLSVWLRSKGFPQRYSEHKALLQFTRDDIPATGARRLSDLLRRSPRVRIQHLANYGDVLTLAPPDSAIAVGCPVGIVYNGALVRPGKVSASTDAHPAGMRALRLDDLLEISRLDGLELYERGASPLPADSTCGTLLLWNWLDRRAVDYEVYGGVRGNTVDLATGQPLGGVRVDIEPGSNSVISDAAGEFSVARLLPGHYQVRAEYPGASLWQEAIELKAWSTLDLQLQLASSLPIALETASVLTGMVFDSTNKAPLAGAQVYLAGEDRRVQTDADGHFRFANLAPGWYAVSFRHPRLNELGWRPDTLQVEIARRESVDVLLAIPSHPPLPLAMPALDSVRRATLVATVQPRSIVNDSNSASARGSGGGRSESVGAPARIFGRVLDNATGRGIGSVRVTLSGTDVSAMSGADGRFRLENIPPGVYEMVADNMTYRTRRDSIALEPGGIVDATLPLATRAVPLPAITVEVRSGKLMDSGFYDRREHAGFNGTFITRADIERQAPVYFTDLVQKLPGSIVMFVEAGRRVIRFRRWPDPEMRGDRNAVYGCVPDIYLDGALLQDHPGGVYTARLSDYNMVDPTQIEGVEIYMGANTPIQYKNPCGVVLIWTRRGGGQQQPVPVSPLPVNTRIEPRPGVR